MFEPNTAAPPETSPAPLPVEEAPAEERWEIASQWKRAWAAIKWTAYGITILAALVIIGQIYTFSSLFFGIHPFLGGLFIGVVTAALVWFILRPAWKFLRMPAVAQPPEVELHDPALTHEDVARRLAYDRTYLRNMLTNPVLTDKRTAIEAALIALDRLEAEEKQDTPRAAGDHLAAFENDRILPLLNDLDKQVDAYIRKEALGVGTATAVSLNGIIDAFIVLWRNINMISRIGRLYYGRPSLRLSFKIIGDVAAAVVLARIADDVSEVAGDTIGGLMNHLGGIVAGPVMNGSVNALMTLKLGYAAKRRCRSFEVWNRRKAMQVAADVFTQVRKEAGSLISDLLKISGGVTGTAADVAQKAWSAPKSAWSMVQNTLGKKRPEDPTPGSGN